MMIPEAYVVDENVLLVRVEEREFGPPDIDDEAEIISINDPRLTEAFALENPEGDAYSPDVTVAIH